MAGRMPALPGGGRARMSAALAVPPCLCVRPTRSLPLPVLLFDLQLEGDDGERLVLAEAVEEGRAAQERTHLLGHGVDVGRALLLGAYAGGVLVGFAAEELLEEAARRGVDDAAHALVGGNLRELLRYLDGLLHAAELVNEPALLRLRARPHAPLRDRVHGLYVWKVSPLLHLREELLPVEVVHVALKLLALVGREGLGLAEHAGVLPAHDVLARHAYPVVEAFDDGLVSEDADGARQRQGLRDYLVRARRDVVAARRGEVAHGDDDGLLLLRLLDGLPDEV